MNKTKSVQLDIKEIEERENLGFYFEAAQIAEEAGLTKRAISNYKKAQHFNEAAHLAQNAGMIEEAVNNYLKCGLGAYAGMIAKNAGLKEKALECFEKVGAFEAAGDLLRKENKKKADYFYKKAINEDMRSASRWESGGFNLDFNGDHTGYSMAEYCYTKALHIAEKAKMSEEVINLYKCIFEVCKKAKDFEGAKKTALKIKKLESSVLI